MERDRRNQISNLYHAALERAPDTRGAFLREACDGDEALRHEIESLLGYESASARFLDTPAALIAGDMAETPDKRQMIGRQFGPYAIIAPLGAGGMARSIARATASSGATSRSRSCRHISLSTPSVAPVSRVKRASWPRSTIPISARYTGWKKPMA